jgi:hypothetical protein
MTRVLFLLGLLWAMPVSAQPAIVASYPSESFGGALANAANSDPLTVMYCAFDSPDGTSLPNCGTNAVLDSAGWRNGHGVPALTWAMTGTVPKVTQTALYPNGFESKHAGLGGFAADKYLSLGTGSDVLDFAGDFTMGIIFNMPTVGASALILADGAYNSMGYGARVDAAGTVRVMDHTDVPTARSVVCTGTVVAGADNVLVVGRYGVGTLFCLLNTGAETTSALVGNVVPDTTHAAVIGGGAAPYGAAGVITIKEVFATSTASAAFATSLTTQALSCTKPGPCLPDDAGTVMHCYVPSGGGKWLCPINTGGTAWTENGTVPKVADARYSWPAGATKADAEGAGPFSDANYLRLGTGADILDFAGDFSCCSAFGYPANLANAPIVLSNGTWNGAGYYSIIRSDGKFGLDTNSTGASRSVSTVNAIGGVGSGVGLGEMNMSR